MIVSRLEISERFSADYDYDYSRMLGYATGIAERGSPYGDAEQGEEFWRLVSPGESGHNQNIKASEHSTIELLSAFNIIQVRP